MQGRVKLWFPRSYYGVIAVEGDQTFFFHGSALVDREAECRTGDQVEFWLDDDPRHADKVIAIDVTILPRVRY